MGDGIENERAKTLAFLRRFATRDILQRLGTINCDGGKSADRLEGIVRELHFTQAQQATRTDARPERYVPLVGGQYLCRGQRQCALAKVRDLDGCPPQNAGRLASDQ